MKSNTFQSNFDNCLLFSMVGSLSAQTDVCTFCQIFVLKYNNVAFIHHVTPFCVIVTRSNNDHNDTVL
jgi:hypothetical protein